MESMESVAMFVNNWLAILATTGNLGLVIVILRRAQPSPMRLPLLLLSATMTVWSFATAMYGMFGLNGWRWLSVMAAPFMVPLALDVVLAFGGRRRKYAWFVWLMYSVYTVLSLAGGWLLHEGVRSDTHPHAQMWAAVCLAGVVAPLMYVTYRLHRHARERPSEATQARVLLIGLLIGLAIGSTELLNNFFPQLPALGQLGTLTVASTLTIVTLRFQLFDVRVAVSGWLIGVGVALAVISGYLLFFGTSQFAFALFVATALTFVGVVAFRELVLAKVRQRERMEQFATLGRFSAQMAHDLKNPLAALKGALQFMEVELEAKQKTQHNEVVGLLNQQVRRVESIVDRYHRMSAVEPRRVAFSLQNVCEEQIALAETSHPEVVFETRFAEVAQCDGDEDLLALVVQNIVSNAAEAGSRRVELQLESTWGSLVVRVRDDGVGMGARDLERAYDDFYTTKPGGSGLGLGFARRVVQAHGGRIELRSTVDSGTEVTIDLPSA